MHYKEQHTDKELLEKGWLQMYDQLDIEMPQERKSDKWCFLLIAGLLLAGAIVHLQHTHRIEPNAIATNEVVQYSAENPTFANVITPEVNEKLAIHSELNQEQAKNLQNKIQDPSIHPLTSLVKRSSQKTVTPAQARQASLATQLYEKAIQRVDTHNTTTTTHQRTKASASSYDSNELTYQQELLVSQAQETTRVLVQSGPQLPLLESLYITDKDDRPLPKVITTTFPRQRSVTPLLSIGLLRSVAIKTTGIYVGFGLNHHLKSRPKLSLRYLLSTNYLPDNATIFGTSEEDALGVNSDVPDIELEEEAINNPVENPTDNQGQHIDTENHYQLSASVVGYYRLYSRLSIGVGASLTFQDFKFSSRGGAYRDQDIKTYNQFSGLVYVSTPIHLTPRLSLEPYYQYQLTAGEIKANQAGLNLTFGLTK